MLPIEIISPTTADSTSIGLEAPTQAPPVFEALFLGVSNFGSGFHDLPATPRDANALYLELTNGAYGNFRACQFTNLTRSQWKGEVQAFCQRVRSNPNTIAVLYLSTHGFYSSQGYVLCARDSLLQDGTPKNVIPFGELRTWLSPIQNVPVVILLDSCRNALSTTRRSTSNLSLQSEPPQAREDVSLYGENWAILTAASWGEFSHERRIGESGPHGLFTHALLEVWQQSRTEDAHGLDVRVLYERMERRLLQTLRESNLSIRQNPRCYLGNLKSQNIPLGSWVPSKTIANHQRTRRFVWGSFVALVMLLGAFTLLGLFAIDVPELGQDKRQQWVPRVKESQRASRHPKKRLVPVPFARTVRCFNPQRPQSGLRTPSQCLRCVKQAFQGIGKPSLFRAPLLQPTGHQYRGLCLYEGYLRAGQRCAKACYCRYSYYCKAYLKTVFHTGQTSSDSGKSSPSLASPLRRAGEILSCRRFVTQPSGLHQLRPYYGRTAQERVALLCLQHWKR